MANKNIILRSDSIPKDTLMLHVVRRVDVDKVVLDSHKFDKCRVDYDFNGAKIIWLLEPDGSIRINATPYIISILVHAIGFTIYGLQMKTVGKHSILSEFEFAVESDNQ